MRFPGVSLQKCNLTPGIYKIDHPIFPPHPSDSDTQQRQGIFPVINREIPFPRNDTGEVICGIDVADSGVTGQTFG